VDEQKIEKAGAGVAEDAAIRLLAEDLRYVSRGGLKLEHALTHWNIDLGGKTCLDVGASTGGFTDAMLQHGAVQVLAVDTGYGQIAAALRNDPRVGLLERTNARHLTAAQLRPLTGEPVGFLAMDVAFISATLVLPAVVASVRELNAASPLASPVVESVVLVKPQFEAGKGNVGKGGIVRDEAVQQAAVERVRAAVEALGGNAIEVIDSPITGAEGNKEFLLHATFKVAKQK